MELQIYSDAMKKDTFNVITILILEIINNAIREMINLIFLIMGKSEMNLFDMSQ